MALNLPTSCPIFAPLSNPAQNHRPSTELRFSRWNHSNATKLEDERRRGAQNQIDEDDTRRYDSISTVSGTSAANSATETFKPSRQGKKAKHSRNPNPSSDHHPAFRRVTRPHKLSTIKPEIDRKAKISIGDDGLSYVIDGAPFEFKYSYTETPKAKPIKLREPPYAPFGPNTMGRPWTGKAPMKKKDLKEFDSFKLPPPHKKGVKPVQKPGPYLAGSGPKYVKSREEILGEPLTREEVKDLVYGCVKTKRQLNMGRDGLTHNMLDNIHAHWKRRRVCKIKCKGVCTVDMENVCQQLEERTGGKIIYRRGGVIFLFRGRNYNYKSRPRFPLMLWRPITPVYPRLVQQAPEGLTVEEATEMRKKGRNLIPIRRLGKNGVYSDLVGHVREAFEECELVRVDCQGMNGSDYRKIGGKLKDLVPCVLISFERESILMWRGREWKSSLPNRNNDIKEVKVSDVDDLSSIALPFEGQDACDFTDSVKNANPEMSSISSIGSEVMGSEGREDPSLSPSMSIQSCAIVDTVSTVEANYETISEVKGLINDEAESEMNAYSGSTIPDNAKSADDEPQMIPSTSGIETLLDNVCCADELSPTSVVETGTIPVTESPESKLGSLTVAPRSTENPQDAVDSQIRIEQASLSAAFKEKVLSLLNEAVESGSALLLDESSLDADIIYQRSVALSKSAPPGPVFKHPRHRRVSAQKVKKVVLRSEDQEAHDSEVQEITVYVKKGSEKKDSKVKRTRRRNFGELDSAVPQGSLKVDELAKLLA